MRIGHIAIWVSNLEKLKDFYATYFKLNCNTKYINQKKQFSSYFLSFNNGNCRIELMHNPEIAKRVKNNQTAHGLHHFTIALGSKEKVNELPLQLHKDGFWVESKPRTTGDGY